MLRYLLATLLCLSVLYGFVEAWPLLAGPSLSVSFPSDFTTLPNGIAKVQGTALRTARLTLNGKTVLPDQDGRFASVLTFARGSSILTFVAADRFGRTVTATRTVFVP